VSVLDASALLAFLAGEPGEDVVLEALEAGSTCSAANWSEVAQKVGAAGADWELSRALLLSYGLQIEEVTIEDAEWAARRWRRGEGLSLADRLCLALADRLDQPVLTADQHWGEDGRITQIRSAPPTPR
jgi:PIN domain nuclease of toxin-antitoxin system